MSDADVARPRPEVLFIGGRSGAGKTSVAAELHTQLSTARVRHCVIEGDVLDLAWPVPWQHGLALAEANLAAMWHTYQEAGYARLVYANTASVRGEILASLLAALGGDPVVHAVLLTATDETAAGRLRQREVGTDLEASVVRSRRAAVELEDAAPPWVRRIATDGRGVTAIARELVPLLGWSPLPQDR